MVLVTQAVFIWVPSYGVSLKSKKVLVKECDKGKLAILMQR